MKAAKNLRSFTQTQNMYATNKFFHMRARAYIPAARSFTVHTHAKVKAAKSFFIYTCKCQNEDSSQHFRIHLDTLRWRQQRASHTHKRKIGRDEQHSTHTHSRQTDFSEALQPTRKNVDNKQFSTYTHSSKTEGSEELSKTHTKAKMNVEKCFSSSMHRRTLSNQRSLRKTHTQIHTHAKMKTAKNFSTSTHGKTLTHQRVCHTETDAKWRQEWAFPNKHAHAKMSKANNFPT